jgi:Ca2+-binding EF-hand superfamily protein
MKSRLKLSAAAAGVALAISVASFAVAGDRQADRAERAKQMWQELDADKDGRVSQAEAANGKRGHLAEHFAAIDANQDGFLTPEEMQAKRGEMRAKMRNHAKQKWQDADSNGDGQLSLDEAQAKMPRLAERFMQLDGDKNGYLTPQEIRAGHHGGKRNSTAP